MSKTKILTILLISASLGLAGCNTINVPASADEIVISKGMSSLALVEMIGEPLEVKPYREDIEGAELWVYERSDIDTKMVSTDLEERIYVDPISGRETTVYVNVMNPETRVSETKTVFLIINGKVEAWKVEQDERSYL